MAATKYKLSRCIGHYNSLNCNCQDCILKYKCRAVSAGGKKAHNTNVPVTIKKIKVYAKPKQFVNTY